MRFIADENVSRLVIDTLREQGHDVLAVVQAGMAGASDDEVVARGLAEK